MYTLDTNPIIYWLKNEEKATSVLQGLFSANETIFISAITLAELFSQLNLSLSEQAQIVNLSNTMTIVPVDNRLAINAGILRGNYGIKLDDAIIATTALSTGSTLVTRNIKHFQGILNLKLLEI